MLRARLRAGSTRPERARELIAADIASAWRDDDDGGRGRSPRARPRDMPASSLADLGGAVRGDASLGTIPRSMRGIDGALSHYQLPSELPSVSGSHLGHAQRARFPFDRSRGFAASAFGVERHARRFAASASPEPARSTSSSPTPPFPLDTSKLGSPEPQRRDASAMSPGRPRVGTTVRGMRI